MKGWKRKSRKKNKGAAAMEIILNTCCGASTLILTKQTEMNGSAVAQHETRMPHPNVFQDGVCMHSFLILQEEECEAAAQP